MPAYTLPGWTPLHMAAREGYTDVVTLLLEKGAKVKQAKNGGRTPMYGAACDGRTGVEKLLLEQKADPNIANKDGDAVAFGSLQRSWRDAVAYVSQRR